MKLTPNFSARGFTKKLLREARSGALATLMPGSNDPYCSLINVATTGDGSPILLISKLAIHTKNILADSRVSIMLDERTEGDPLEGGRIMLMGTAQLTGEETARKRYLERHPDAKMFTGFHDFGFYKMTVKGIHLVAGFGRILDLKPEVVLTQVDDASRLMKAEQDILAHLNEDHAETCRLYATKLLGAQEGEWRFVGCDPEGVELQLGQKALRLTFAQRARTPGAVRKALKELADKARAA